MKFTAYLLIVVAHFFFVSCKKEPGSLNENFISVNKCQSFKSDGIELNCCLDSVIQDSRCPIDAVCVWQGIAVARFGVNSQNTDHTITLATSKFASYHRDTIVGGFRIELINLSPQKDMSKPFKYDDYVAEIKITKP